MMTDLDESNNAPKIGNEPDTPVKKPAGEETPDAANKDYDKKFNRLSKRLSKLEKDAASGNKINDAAGDEDSDDDIDRLKAQEMSPKTIDSTVNYAAESRTDAHHKQAGIGRVLLGKLRKGSAFGFIIGIILMGVGYASVFAPNIILVNIKEMYTNDLADATVALHTYYKIALDQKLSGGDCGEQDSIKCKLTTMSRNQVKNLQRHGFTVSGSKLKEDNMDDRDPRNDAEEESRWKVSSVSFPHGGGGASNGDSWFKAANKSFSMKELAYSVFNPQSSFFMDERFETRIKTKFALTKFPTTGGSEADAIDKSFDKSLKGKDEKFDEAGRAGIGLNTLKTDDASKQLKEVAKKIGAKANTYIDLQCAYYTYGKVVYNSSRTALEHTIARFAYQYLIAADQVKNGQSDEMTTNTLSDKLAYSNDGGYNGKNATDSSLYRHIVLREGFKDSENGTKYFADPFDAIGELAKAWLPQLFIAATSVGKFLGAPGGLTIPPADIASKPRDYCLFGETTQNVQNEKTPKEKCGQLALMTATPIAQGKPVPEVTAKLQQIIDPCRQIWEFGPWLVWPSVRVSEPIITPYVADELSKPMKEWADKKSKDFTADTKGTAASDAIFAGTGIILSDMGISRGMRPADKQSLTKYLQAGAKIKQDYRDFAMEQGRRTPFDVYNQYSFMGQLARTATTAGSTETPLLATIYNIANLLPSAFGSLTKPANAIYYLQPDEFESGRLKCTDMDAEYKHIGIEADVACNIRVSMSDKELKADPKQVLDYMLKEHPDETKDGIKELEERLQKTDSWENRDKPEVQRMLDEAKKGSQSPMIDKKTGKPMKHTEYEKFMDYCVNREDPWGRSAVVVRREELSDEEKKERMKTKDENATARVENDKGDVNELKFKELFMAVTEGTKADQDWYTGKKCLDDSEMLTNFRAYTMLCSVDGSLSGARDCTQRDDAQEYNYDGFYRNNNILYLSNN